MSHHIYDITFLSEHKYESLASEAFFQFLILPCNNREQELLSYSVKHSGSSDFFTASNAFGFTVLSVRIAAPFSDFKIEVKAKVEVQDAIKVNKPSLKAFEVLRTREFYIDHHFFLDKTKLTNLAGVNSSVILKRKESQDLYTFLEKLCAHVHGLLEYQTEFTDVTTTAEEALALKKGVCQDFAHIFIGMARQNGLPCRYVSGYLNQLQGTGDISKMHAWTETFVPEIGWVGFDPGNKMAVNNHYIKVSHGVDYLDCSPVKGALFTNGMQSAYHKVQVAHQ